MKKEPIELFKEHLKAREVWKLKSDKEKCEFFIDLMHETGISLLNKGVEPIEMIAFCDMFKEHITDGWKFACQEYERRQKTGDLN